MWLGHSLCHFSGLLPRIATESVCGSWLQGGQTSGRTRAWWIGQGHADTRRTGSPRTRWRIGVEQFGLCCTCFFLFNFFFRVIVHERLPKGCYRLRSVDWVRAGSGRSGNRSLFPKRARRLLRAEKGNDSFAMRADVCV